MPVSAQSAYRYDDALIRTTEADASPRGGSVRQSLTDTDFPFPLVDFGVYVSCLVSSGERIPRDAHPQAERCAPESHR